MNAPANPIDSMDIEGVRVTRRGLEDIQRAKLDALEDLQRLLKQVEADLYACDRRENAILRAKSVKP